MTVISRGWGELTVSGIQVTSSVNCRTDVQNLIVSSEGDIWGKFLILPKYGYAAMPTADLSTVQQ